MTRIPLLLALLLVPHADVRVHVDELSSLRAELVAAFEELAGFCQREKLFLQRDRLFESILVIDEDHAEARKTLGYRRSDGAWTRGDYHRPKDRGGDEALAELARKRKEHASAFAERLAPLLAGRGLEEREREVRFYFLLDREDAGLNGLTGRVRDAAGNWRDERELAAEERRAVLRAAAADALAKTPELEPWTVEPPVDGLGLAWAAGFRTERVRVAGTGSPSEVRRATEVAHAIDDFLPVLLPPGPAETFGRGAILRERRTNPHPMYRRFVVYLLAECGDVPALLAGWPELSTQARELYPSLSTAFLDENNSFGVWVEDEAERLDALTRQLVGAYLRDRFGLSTQQGWVWEGFGIYLTHLLIGTRRTFFVRPSEYVAGADVSLEERLLRPDADWIGELLAVAADGRRPRLSYLLGKDVNSMDVRDLLLAHALAAYLLEERHERIPRVLGRLGEGRGSKVVLEEELGKALPALEEELYAWAARRRP